MKHHEVLITVYITNYNYGNYLKTAVESVLKQTLQDFEIIIIDDGSTDHSREIIDAYHAHPSIKVIFQQNKGLNVTNNIALRVANGKYIMRLDADDYLDHNALLVMSNLLEQDEQLGLVFPDYYLVDAEGNIDAIHRRHDFEQDVSLFDQAAHGACTMIRTDFLKELGGYNEDYSCQDGYELWVKFTSKYKVRNINTPLFYYRQHGKNLTKNENRILSTRANINKDYIKNAGNQFNTIVIIPVRDAKSANNTLAFTKIEKTIALQWKIEAASKAENIASVIVTSPDPKVFHWLQDHYQDHAKIRFIERPKEEARLNVGLVGTVNRILADEKVKQLHPAAVMLLAVEYPFISSETLDDAVNTLFLFDSDSLISVRPDTNMFYQHHGHGMQPILNLDKFTRLEREALFRYTGGISVTRTATFLKNQQFITGKVGHIIIDQLSAHGVFSEHDLKVAQLLAQSETIQKHQE